MMIFIKDLIVIAAMLAVTAAGAVVTSSQLSIGGFLACFFLTLLAGLIVHDLLKFLLGRSRP